MKTTSLYFKFAVTTIVTVFIIMTLQGVYDFISEKTNTEKRLKSIADKSITKIQNSIGCQIAAYSQYGYENIIETEMVSKEILAIIVLDKNMEQLTGKPYIKGKIRNNKWSLVDYNPELFDHTKMLNKNFYSLTKEVTNKGKLLGVVKIFMTSSFLTESLNKLILSTIIKAILVATVLCLVILFAMRFFITTPLKRVIDRISHFGEVEYYPIQLPIKSRDEIGTLVESFNKMTTQISKNIHQRKITEQMKLAKESAEAATKAKSEFLAYMSHEIRSPMTVILGFSQLIQEKSKDPKLLEYINVIIKSCNSLMRLINDLLELSKMEAGKINIQYDPIKIQSVIQSISIMFQPRIKTKELDFILDISKDIPQILFLDEFRLQQILINLLTNSIKFTDKGYIKLSITCDDIDINNNLNLNIFIEDSGLGIPDQDQKTIFDAFTQTKGQKIKKYGGTGLGLAITKSLVTEMNGSITLTSEYGKGTVIKIKLFGVGIGVCDAITVKKPKK